MPIRNYRKEYDNYHSKPEQRIRNAARLRARRLMVKNGKVKKNDKKDVHHKDHDAMNNDPTNLSVVTQKYNRTEPRLRKEDAPVNSTGPAVKGTGDDHFTGRKKKKKKLSDVTKKYKNKKDSTWDSTWESTQESVAETDISDTPDSTFASMPVFTVNDDEFAKCKFGKDKFARWAKHINTDSDQGKRIHSYAKKNPKKSIIVQHEKSGHMLYLRKFSKKED